jgi:hypothetical protein
MSSHCLIDVNYICSLDEYMATLRKSFRSNYLCRKRKYSRSQDWGLEPASPCTMQMSGKYIQQETLLGYFFCLYMRGGEGA